MPRTTTAHNHLLSIFSQDPLRGRQSMTVKEWNETAMATTGQIIVYNRAYDLIATKIAPDVYVITAKRHGAL